MPVPDKLQLVSWVLVVVGWIIVNQQNNHREARKEIRASLDKIKTRLDELEKKALDYHCGKENTPENARFIKLEISRIYFELSYLKIVEKDVNQLIRELRKAVTLENFESHKFAPQQPDGPIVSHISEKKDQIVRASEYAFAEKFRRSLRERIAAV